MSKLTKFLLLIVFLTPFTSAVSVGVSPGFIDLGEVEPGTTQEIDFYITTNSEEPFQLDPSYDDSLRVVGPDAPIQMENVSEQDIAKWISWTQDTYTIDPNTSTTYSLPDGTSVNAEGRITMEVSIPPNAEPGYRIGDIQLEPGISAGRSGAGARVLAQTVPTFAFRVPGNVQRDIDMSGLEAVRTGENRAQLILQLRNTGTSTARFTKGKAEIFDDFGNKVGEISFDPATLAPGEYAEIDSIWGSNDLEGGEYTIEGTGDYSTGQTHISGSFVITDTIQERQNIDEPSGGEAVEEQENVPLVMIVILSLLLATLLYILDIEMTWIIMLSGGVAVGLYILLGPVSNALVLIPLLSIAIMLYL